MSEIKLVVDPGKVVSWEDFISVYPKNSIALDGFVRGVPRFTTEHWVNKANFNHHEDVSRLETRATCAQVLMAIRQGLIEAFKDARGNTAFKIYVNDCDEDVCLSVFLLRFYFLVEKTMNPLINQLSAMEDMLDTTAGAYAFPRDLPSLRRLLWVFEPYHRFRAAGALAKKDANEYRCIIDDVGRRIMSFLVGSAESIELDTRYNVSASSPGWFLVQEVGAHSRLGMFADGIKAFVSVRERGNDVFDYVLGRISQVIPFNVPLLYEKLNEQEQCEGTDKWGGSDTIGGSPRSRGSRIPPQELATMIRSWLEQA